ncbi:hypothetical protein KP509_07G020400 [Ceratopteris richardii]|uniref:Uncharacterized protein n=1 Tax=Ceratopteris richardii TaxID=49495 RepID=A0A8T2UCJ2_CERRI|nr:hypothetical protein KP509_07G020400 [Ceratopteris richardii]
MAGIAKLAVRWRGRSGSPACIRQCLRHSHSQSLWEHILGRKVDRSSLKALEDAALEFRLSNSVPSWLPFMPNSSFWIPSSEIALKNLEELAERIKSSQRPQKPLSAPSFIASADLRDNGVSSSKALSAIRVTDQLIEKIEGIPLDDGTKILLVDASDLESGTDEDDDDDGDDEDEEIVDLDESEDL